MPSASACSTPWAQTAAFPSRPIKLVVPYAPGGGADGVARIVAKRVSEQIGQPIVIENKGGAGSIVGTDLVAKAEPDGYTLLLGQSGPISINPAVYKSLPYDPVKDFAPITMTTGYPYILVVNAELPVKTLQEFVALARSKPGAMNYGSTGVGAANHLVAIYNVACAEMTAFCRHMGLDPAVALKHMGNSPYIGTGLMRLRMPMMIKRQYQPPSMKTHLWQKDMQIITDMARAVHCPTPLLHASAGLYNAAMALGLEEHDTAATAEAWAALPKRGSLRRRKA